MAQTKLIQFLSRETHRHLVRDYIMALMMMRYTPHALMILAQVFFTLLYFITEAAFNGGLNPYVYVTYRYLLAACILCPFAYFYEKYIC